MFLSDSGGWNPDPCKKNGGNYNEVLLFMVAGCFRLSDWGPAMGHDEPGQVGNQAALNRPFHVSDSIPADDFFFALPLNGLIVTSVP